MLKTEYYSKDYLRKGDSETVDEIRILQEEIFSDSAIEEFFENKLTLNSETAKSLVKEELLAPFAEHLRERIEYFICDFIISKIDNYPNDDYEALKASADERKRLMLAGATNKRKD